MEAVTAAVDAVADSMAVDVAAAVFALVMQAVAADMPAAVMSAGDKRPEPSIGTGQSQEPMIAGREVVNPNTIANIQPSIGA
jgi:hypothetical protein